MVPGELIKAIIRDAVIEDLDDIVGIYNSTIPGRMVTADTEKVTVESKKQWFYEHSNSFRPLWAMENNGKIIGWLSFQSFYGRPAYNTTAEISIYIHENYRGLGLGNQFLTEALNKSFNYGIKTLLGFIFAHNTPSLSLFSKSSFEKWAHLPRVAEIDHLERDLIIMGKRVNI